jgi:hypothetical protein
LWTSWTLEIEAGREVVEEAALVDQDGEVVAERPAEVPVVVVQPEHGLLEAIAGDDAGAAW